MKVKTNYANTPAWREVNVKSRIPEPLKMLEGSGIVESRRSESGRFARAFKL